ncbi:MAG: hypothetical protein QOF77_1362 [Solirubrobacteraceae bacterium]|jgi:hypothetical protein|nr:hypothetical protein [Solirubrobacteraceae bacterium]
MGLLILRVVAGNAAGTELRLEDEVLIGRSAGDPGSLGNDETLSRRHARLRPGPDATVLIEDLGSHNGTRVNGRVIDAPVALSPGDRIELGQSTLELVEAAPPTGSDATRVSASPAGQAAPVAPGDAEQAAPFASGDAEQDAPVDAEEAAPVASGDAEQDAPVASDDAERPTPTSPQQATRLSRAAVDSGGAQPTRIGAVPAGLEAGGAQPTRIGRVPDEIAVEAKGEPTRIGRVPPELGEAAAGRGAAGDQATRIARTPLAPAPSGAEAQPTRLARVPGPPPGDSGDGPAPEGADEAVPARRVPWWKRLLRRSR